MIYYSSSAFVIYYDIVINNTVNCSIFIDRSTTKAVVLVSTSDAFRTIFIPLLHC